MNRLDIYLLGSTRVDLDHRTVQGLEANKPGALFAYLLLEARRAHARPALAALFWPERSDREALESLRFALSNLRAALQDRGAGPLFLLVDRREVRVNPQAEIWLDVIAFQQRAALCAAQAKNGPAPSIEALQAALSLYRGSFLQNYSLSEGTGFDAWAIARRDHCERQRLHLLNLLAGGYHAASSFSQAEEVYRNILGLQPWDEVTHRKLMRLLADAGDRSAALNQYETCRQALVNILGVKPEGQTDALMHEIQKKASASLGLLQEREAASSLPQPGMPFVARERELTRLGAALERSLSGQGQMVLVTGEAGSGKTSLLSEFAHRALDSHANLVVVGGCCNAFAGVGQPYLPFVESVQMLAGEWDTLPWTGHLDVNHQLRLQAMLPWIAQTLVETAPALLDRFVGRAELARHIPERPAGAMPIWEKLLRKAGPKAKLHAPLETGLLFEQVTRLLTTLAQRSPLVLLFDDLQWIDSSSAALLFHLARRCASSPLLIAAAYRPIEDTLRSKTGEHPLSQLINELRRSASCLQMDLDQCDERLFITNFLQKDPLLQPNRLDDGFRDALIRHTGGNPLFTQELLRGLQFTGDLRCDTQGVWISSPSLNWQHLPEHVEATIAGAIAHLPEPWRDWLATASVEGDTFSAETLARVHKISEEALLNELSGPLNAARGSHRLLKSEGVQWLGSQRFSLYRFRHALFQTYLYEQLDPVERSHRHAAVGQALEELCAGQPEAVSRQAAELARHFEAGGQPRRAAHYCLEAGKHALYLGSVQAAIGIFQHGLDLLAGLPRTPEQDRLKVNFYLELSTSFLSTSGWAGTDRHEAIERAIALLKEAGNQDHWSEFYVALYAQADWLISQHELTQAIQLGEQMLTLITGADPWPLAQAHRTLGISHFFAGQFPAARYHLEKALAACEVCDMSAGVPLAGSEMAAGCRIFLAVVLARQGYADQADCRVAEAMSQAHATPHNRVGLGVVLIVAGEVAHAQKNLPGLHALADELLGLGQADEIPTFLAYGRAFKGLAQVQQAATANPQAVAGLELIRGGMRLWETTGQRSGLGQWVNMLADACIKTGQTALGLETLRHVLEPMPARGMNAGLARLYRLQGELLLQQTPPDPGAAQASFEKALATARLQEAHTLELEAAIAMARLWQVERPAEARRLLVDICSWFTEGWESPVWQEAQALLRTLGGFALCPTTIMDFTAAR